MRVAGQVMYPKQPNTSVMMGQASRSLATMAATTTTILASQSAVRMATLPATPAASTGQAGLWIPTRIGKGGVPICMPNQKRDVTQPAVVINLPCTAASSVHNFNVPAAIRQNTRIKQPVAMRQQGGKYGGRMK